MELKVHLKDPKHNFPFCHFDVRLEGKRLTSNPKEVTCKTCLKAMARDGVK